MTTTLEGIIALIKTKLEGIQVDSEDAFGTVLDYADGDFGTYPTAVIVEVNGEGEVMDTHRNQRTHRYEVRLYQEQSRAGKTKQEAATLMRKITDQVLTAFDEDKDLGGEVDIVRVVSFDMNFKVAAGTFNFATFRLDVVVLVENHE